MSQSNVNTLEQLRLKIDDIDSEMLKLLQKRVSIAIEMGKLKKAEGRTLRDTARENKLILRLLEENKTKDSKLSSEDLRSVYTLLMTICLKVQD